MREIPLSPSHLKLLTINIFKILFSSFSCKCIFVIHVLCRTTLSHITTEIKRPVHSVQRNNEIIQLCLGFCVQGKIHTQSLCYFIICFFLVPEQVDFLYIFNRIVNVLINSLITPDHHGEKKISYLLAVPLPHSVSCPMLCWLTLLPGFVLLCCSFCLIWPKYLLMRHTISSMLTSCRMS